MPCHFSPPSTPLRRTFDLFLPPSPLYSVCSPSANATIHKFASMISIIFDNYAYELGVKTVLAGILALLLGLAGFIMSIFALGVIWLVPTMRTRIPPYRKPNPLHRGLKKSRGHVLMSSPELVPPLLPPIHLESNTPSLRRAASFPDLHTPSQERPFTTSRHVSFHVENAEICNPSLARSLSFHPSSTPPTNQRHWSHHPFCKRRCRSTQGESVSYSRTSPEGESNHVTCSYTSFTSQSDLPLKCLDERCECHDSRNSVGCDEHGQMNRPQVDSLSEGTTSTRSTLTLSLWLPSVRKAFIGIPRLAKVPPRTSTSPTVSPSEQSQNPKLTSESLGKGLPLSPTLLTSGEEYRAEYVSPFRTKKSKTKPKLEALKFSRKSKFSFSPPWSSPKSPGASPSDADASTTSPTSPNSPSGFRRALASRFTPSLKSPTFGSLSSSTLEIPSRLSPSFTSRSVPRTQPYGPPWNAVMPGQGYDSVYSSLDDVLIKKSSRRRSGGPGEFKSPTRTLAPIVAPVDGHPFAGFVDEPEECLSN